MKEKREPLYYIVAFLLMAIAIGMDIYFGTGTEYLASYFKGSILDWVGIILFNAGLFGMAAGMLGMWEEYSMSAASFGKLWVVALAASIILIIV